MRRRPLCFFMRKLFDMDHGKQTMEENMGCVSRLWDMGMDGMGYKRANLASSFSFTPYFFFP